MVFTSPKCKRHYSTAGDEPLEWPCALRVQRTFTKDLTANPDKGWKPTELVAYLLDEKPPFEAGKGWDYSDTNYIVLGMIIEKVTGKKFYDEATKRLLNR